MTEEIGFAYLSFARFCATFLLILVLDFRKAKPISSVIYAKFQILIRYMCVQDVDLQILGSRNVKVFEMNERC
jgi:hypothetical protein